MSGRFLAAIVCLSATIGVLLGLVVSGSMTPVAALPPPSVPPAPAVEPHVGPPRTTTVAHLALPSFADVAERLNPSVVNIDAMSASSRRPTWAETLEPSELFERPSDRERTRRGAGSGFIIDPDGYILTNEHLVEGAHRITVRLADGRSLRATRVGTDPETDVALLKVEAGGPLPIAPLGDSDALRVGEWVVAIGNPLAYERTVTVGIVSFIGRKLFNTPLDRYIQTDAAINLGNSGGPLINTEGEVVGINSAVSSRAANIGFAVPINQATAILPQLREDGRVSRGFIGVGLRDVDADLQRSLNLLSSSGALVQDVSAGSPGARAGLRPYDVIVAVDGRAVSGNDELIQLISAKPPGTRASLHVLRDDRALTIPVKLAERPIRQPRPPIRPDNPPEPLRAGNGARIGMSVRALDETAARRLKLPDGMQGVIVTRVDPAGPASDARIERGNIVLEINRQPVRSPGDYEEVLSRAAAGAILALYVYDPETLQRTLHTLTTDQ